MFGFPKTEIVHRLPKGSVVKYHQEEAVRLARAAGLGWVWIPGLGVIEPLKTPQQEQQAAKE